jgi:glycosyltransferase involved in cell wall biosynthesis
VSRPRDDRPHLMLFAEDFYPAERAAGGVRVCVHHHVRELARRWRITVVAPIVLYPPLARYAFGRRVAAEGVALRGHEFGLPGVRVLRPRYLHLPVLSALTEPLQLLLIGLWCWLRHARDAQVLHGHRVYPMGLAAVMLGRVVRRPSVVTAHGSGVQITALRGNWRFRFLTRLAMRNADRVMVVSRALHDIALSLAVKPGRLTYLANGVDLEALAGGDAERGRRLAGFPAERRLVVAVGELVTIKGHTVLIEAFRRLRERRGGDVALALAGNGVLRGPLEQQVRVAGLGDDVHFLGSVPYPQVPDLLAAATIAALPSFNEGMPLAALEALAAGRPLVGSAVGGTREVVQSGRDGLLVPPGDPTALAAALEQALDRCWDPAELRARVRERSWARVVERQEQVYAELIEAARRG